VENSGIMASEDIFDKAVETIAFAEEVLNRTNPAKSLRAAYFDTKREVLPKYGKRVKTVKLAVGDIVGEMDETGEWVETYRVIHKPGVYVQTVSARTGRKVLLTPGKCRRIGPNEWEYVR